MVYKVTRRLVLRTPRLSDASSYIALFLNPPNFAYEPVKPSENLRTIHGCEEYIRGIIDSSNKGESAQMVFVIPTDPTAGYIQE